MKKFIVVLILLLLVGVVIYVYMNQEGQNPSNFMKEYISKINEEEYSSMYEMLTNESKSKISKEDFINRNKNIYSRN